MSQFGRPDTVQYTAGTEPIGAGTRAGAVNEVIQDDNDYVEFTIPNTSWVRWHFSAVTDPGTHIGHIVRFARSASLVGTMDFLYTFEWWNGSSFLPLASFGENGIPNSSPMLASSITLSEAVAASIGDYSNLYFRTNLVGGPADGWVSWVELEVPDEVVNPIGSASISMLEIIASSGATFAGPPRSGTASNTMPEVLAAGTILYDPTPRIGPVSITNPEVEASGFGLFAATVGLAAPSMPEVEASGIGTTLNPIFGDATIELELVSLVTDSTQIQGGIQVGDWQEGSKEVDTWIKDTEEQDVWTEDSKEQDVWS